ncbi:MAG: hypothetical protein RLY61_555 [Candidatus Parcubacteria bacterium]|jgi:hypothetical protein
MPPLTINFTDASGHEVHIEGADKFHTRSASGGGIGVRDDARPDGAAQVYARGELYGDEHLHFLAEGDSVTVDLKTGEQLVVSKP